MLELNNVVKIYDVGGFKHKVLNNVSISFRECEFASILGPSGSGKTTLLNIIGGLDQYTSGDLSINHVSTKKFKNRDWDSYRNHRIGFVFQSYNLIPHQTVLANVKLALTLSGISKKEATNRAKKALRDVGLAEHMDKRPNQLSGGQMQRVAIARALVNNPDILLADEPTGALDSETSVQIMDLLKEIAKEKLVIMVTHNPELAEQYSSRIITLKDGKITSDSNPFNGATEEEIPESKKHKTKKTKMSFFTALSLSLKNLLTKKGRTVLVAFAGSIGIIGIALILAVSTGFQNYVDSIQEETLTSYPLTIMKESSDMTSMLLAMTSGSGENDGSNKVKEAQFVASMLGNISTNDLKTFRQYYESHYDEIKDDISTVKYSYNIDPLIYTVDASNELAKLNPNNLFSSITGQSSLLSSYSSLASVYSQMIDNQDTIREQYDILAGHLPEKYNEMVLVLSEPNAISDLLVYSLGLRDTDELTSVVTKVMSGEAVKLDNEPLEFTYDDLMNVTLKLIQPADIYQYNSKYDVYEDMSSDEQYMQELYDKAENLKIVGIITAKAGTTTTALNPGVAYTSDLIDYIIDYSSESEVVQKQLANKEVDIFSGKRFDDENQNDFDFEFADLVSVDSEKIQSAFNINIDQNDIANKTKEYMSEISDSITTDITPAKNILLDAFDNLSNGLFASINVDISLNEANDTVLNYLNTEEATTIINNINEQYLIPSENLNAFYSGLLTSLLSAYISTYSSIDPSLTTEPSNPTAQINDTILPTSAIITSFKTNTAVTTSTEILASTMTEIVMKKTILTKIGELTTNISSSFANAFNIDQDALISAFQLNFSEDELARVVSAMFTKTESTLISNLSALGYQDKEDPTFISIYFNSFDGKEHFLKFIDDYNDLMESYGQDEKVIRYSDTTGILMDSVKTIVNAVSYVLIAFVSISLVVSSIMIGIITYISVYERTKEIGILRAIGASKHNIANIFNAETFIVGLLSGLFGIGITYIFIPIINTILHHYTGNIPLAASLDPKSAAILIVLSIILTLIGGLIPAKSASKKDPVEALRSE